MDYIKAYNKICENHTNLTDFLNFIENKIEQMCKDVELDYDNDLMLMAERVRKKIDENKLGMINILKTMHELEIVIERYKK